MKTLLVFLCFLLPAFSIDAADSLKFNYVGGGRYVCQGGPACDHYKATRDQQDRREFDRKYEADRYDRKQESDSISEQRRYDKPASREFMK